jgi:thiamine biosynthesis lipoprotein
MGTVARLDLRSGDDDTRRRAAAAALAELASLEDRFSSFRPGSEVSRYARGEVADDRVSRLLREVLDACAEWEQDSGGAFRAVRPDGTLDVAGYVKGWAADRAARLVRAEGVDDFLLEIGGDLVCSGETRTGRPWRVGVRGPQAGDGPAAVIDLDPAAGAAAVATSGRYERGDHLWLGGQRLDDGHSTASFTVVAASLAEADSAATAGYAMGGRDGLDWCAARGWPAMAVLADGTRPCTPGFLDLLTPLPGA